MEVRVDLRDVSLKHNCGLGEMPSILVSQLLRCVAMWPHPLRFSGPFPRTSALMVVPEGRLECARPS